MWEGALVVFYPFLAKKSKFKICRFFGNGKWKKWVHFKIKRHKKKRGKAINNWKKVNFFTFADIGERKTGSFENQNKNAK